LTSKEKRSRRFRKLLTSTGKFSPAFATVGTILEEQQAQRIDIRSLHEEVHATKEELKSEILSARAEAKRTTTDLQATVVRKLTGHEQRIDDLEDEVGTPHPDEN
jgi:hypothetical protein